MATPAALTWIEALDRLRQVTLGEYEIASELGRGGMAAVYLAHDIALNRKVAIKVMSPALLLGPGMLARFKLEAQVVARLTHPHIVTIHAIREVGGLNFLVMKYIEGCPLEAILQHSKALPIPAVRSILSQVGSALAYAHKHGVVHRDVKPGTILIDVEGDAVVSDFGIAKVASAASTTHPGDPVGTPAYMSPEQCESLEITPATDQYSLGIVAFEMLTGEQPFQGSKLAIMRCQVEERPPAILERRPDCPAELASVVDRMLAKSPSARWPSISAALAALDAAPLGAHDPIRRQLGELAGNLATVRVGESQTPVSLPPSRSGDQARPKTPAPAPSAVRVSFLGRLSRRVRIAIGAGAVALIGIILMLVFAGGEKDVPPAAVPEPIPGSLARIELPAGGDLTAALVQVADTGIIRLAAGEYRLSAPLRITKPIAITGAGLDATRITTLASGAAIVIALTASQRLDLSSVSLERVTDQPGDLLRVESGEVWVKASRFSGGGGTSRACDSTTAGVGVTLGPAASGSISHSIVSSNCRGMQIQSSGIVSIDSTQILDNTGPGIVVSGSAEPQIVASTVRRNEIGIYYGGTLGGEATGNEVSENVGEGFYVASGRPSLRGNKLAKNGGHDIAGCRSGAALLAGNSPGNQMKLDARCRVLP